MVDVCTHRIDHHWHCLIDGKRAKYQGCPDEPGKEPENGINEWDIKPYILWYILTTHLQFIPFTMNVHQLNGGIVFQFLPEL